jgi:hyperosmotically inducible periplasmic protein
MQNMSLMKHLKHGLLLSLASALLFVGCAADRYTQATGESRQDAAISSNVSSELQADPEVTGLPIFVKTYRGEVRLSGVVDAETQKARAAQVARNVRGVQWVRNELEVR